MSKKKISGFCLGLIVLAAVVAAIVFIPPWRADAFASRAAEARDAGEPEKAHALAEKALAWDNDSTDAQVLLAEIESNNDPEAARERYAALVEGRPLTELEPRILIGYTRVLQNLDEPAAAAPILQTLEETVWDDPEIQLLEARQSLLEKNYRVAYQQLEEVSDLLPNAAEPKLYRGQLLLQTERPTEWVAGKVLLFEAGRKHDPFGLMALHTLAKTARPVLLSDDRLRLAELLENHPDSDTGEKLLAALQRIIAEPEQKDEIVAAQVERYRESDQKALAQWLALVGDAEQLSDVVKHRDAVGDADFFSLRLQALGASGELGEARRLIEEAGEHLDASARSTMLAALAAGNPSPGENPQEKWEEAFAKAQDAENLSQLIFLARLAVNQGDLNAAARAYGAADQAASEPAELRVIGREYYQILLRLGRLEKAEETLNRIVSFLNEEDPVLNDYAYLKLLTDSDFAGLTPTVERLAETFPDQPPIVSTLALLRWRENRFQEAYEIYQELPEDYRERASIQMLGALIHQGLGNTTEARERLAAVDQDRLLAPELRLLREQFPAS